MGALPGAVGVVLMARVGCGSSECAAGAAALRSSSAGLRSARLAFRRGAKGAVGRAREVVAVCVFRAAVRRLRAVRFGARRCVAAWRDDLR